MAYNRDLQEDKIHLFSAHDTLKTTLEITAAVIRNTTFNTDRLLAATDKGFMDATILAEYLVGKGVPFRQAHHHVGTLVAHAEKDGRELSSLTLDEFTSACDRIGNDVYEYLGPANVVERYRSAGNAGPESVRKQIRFWRQHLDR